MHPSSFEYFAPTRMEEALSLLSKYGGEAKIMAGGQSLIPLLKLRIATFPYVVDISRIRGMDQIKEERGFLEIGALTKISELEDSEIIKEKFQILHEAATQIADPLVRNRGTIGGNISHADPSNDIPAVAIATKAKLEVVGSKEKRTLNADSFITDSFSTALEEGEILSKILIPIPDTRSGGCYIKQKKSAGDFSVAAIAVQMTLGDDDKVRSAGIGLTSVASKPIRAVKAERYIEGKRIDNSVVKEMTKIVVSESDPSTDFYGTAEFKKKILARIAEDAINLSYERAMVK